MLAIVGLVAFVISINLDSSDSASVQEEKMTGTEAASLDSSENGFADSREYGHPIENSLFGEPKDFVLTTHHQWSELEIEEQYTTSPDSAIFELLASIVPEVNYLRTNIDGA